MRPFMLVLALVALLAVAAPAQAVEIHAHRGGPIFDGVPVTPEDTLPAFERGDEVAADVIELDVKLTRDRVPVVIHDATLDRTTTCTGEVAEATLAELGACAVDVVGAEERLRMVAGSSVRIPTLSAVLDWAARAGAWLNIEIKNIPTDSDSSATTEFARVVLDAIEASPVRPERVLIQSFWPPNLDEAERGGFRTALLTLAALNDGSVEYAQARGYEVVSPEWPLSDPREYVERAHAAGLAVVPFTFNRLEEVRAGADAGVDGLIVNDVIVAQRALHGVDCPTARLRAVKRTRSFVAARSGLKRARGRAARRRASDRLARANANRKAAKRLRQRACGGA